MKLERRIDRDVVTLSKRNLIALLDKLNWESARELQSNDCVENGEPMEDFLLCVRVETDEEHYKDRPAPGPMHPRTEAALKAVREKATPKK